MTPRPVTRIRPARTEPGKNGRNARDRALLWLDCRIGERVNVEVGGVWALEAHGELRHWRGPISGLYQVGEDGFLDLSGIREADRVSERHRLLGAEQLIVEFGDGTALTVTVER